MKRIALVVVLATSAPALRAHADPYRIRADALASVPSPVGLVSLDGSAEVEPDVHAEAMLWLGDDGADALIADVEARRGPVVARLGRFIDVLGALRPIHVDGASGRVQLPRRVVLEAFGGVPVKPQLGAASWDWVVGTRASRLLGDWGSVGVAWMQERTEGRLDSHELGVDAGAAIGERYDAGGTVAFDLIHGGVAEARVTASTRRGPMRFEIYAGDRSPGRLLPATSLFSVIGDVEARRGGAEWKWHAAPRLDVHANAGVLAVGTTLGEDLSLRGDLLLGDDASAGALSLELRREGAPEGGWTGARATARVPLPHELSISSELELAIPDSPAMNTGVVWPWALLACGWKHGAWDAAAAIEASATATQRFRFDALARLGRQFL